MMNKFAKIPLWKKRLYLYSGLALALFIAPSIPLLWMGGGSSTKAPAKTEPQGYSAGASHQMCISKPSINGLANSINVQ
jgi:hypothetical protein